jgi:hypothetical protein
MISKTEDLVTIGEYLARESGIFTRNGMIVLHLPQEQEEIPIPNDLIERARPKEDSIVVSFIVSSDSFDSTIFAYRLLSDRNVYYTETEACFFRGGTFGKYEKGHLTYTTEPERGFIELSKKNVKKWSRITKNHRLQDLATCKENVIQDISIFFAGHFFEIFAYPDGRLFLFSPLENRSLKKLLQSFHKIEELIKKTLSKDCEDYSILSSPVNILLAPKS